MSNRGYTLLEILVVLTIISIVAGAGMLSIRYNDYRHIESFSQEVVQLMTLAEEEAMLRPVVLTVNLQNHELQITTTEHALWKTQVIPSWMQVKMSSDVIISTSGDLTPFTMSISRRDEKPHCLIRGEAGGSVSSECFSS